MAGADLLAEVGSSTRSGAWAAGTLMPALLHRYCLALVQLPTSPALSPVPQASKLSGSQTRFVMRTLWYRNATGQALLVMCV